MDLNNYSRKYNAFLSFQKSKKCCTFIENSSIMKWIIYKQHYKNNTKIQLP